MGASLRESEMPEDAPESYKKKMEADAMAEAREESEKYIAKQENMLKRRGQYHRAAAYNAEYASQERELVRQRRQAKAVGNYFCEPEAKLMFVIRIRGMCDMHPKTKKILQLLRLRQIHLGVFLRVNKATQEMIKRVEPYLAYGYPSLKAVRSLIYKRGFGKVKTKGQAQRLPLTTTSASRITWGSTVSTASRTSCTRSTPSAHTSRRPTTSSGLQDEQRQGWPAQEASGIQRGR